MLEDKWFSKWAQSIWYDDWERRLFAMLTCYLDESTAQGERDPATSVAGYVATGKQWANFAKLWNGMLAFYSVPLFHAKEFETEWGRKRARAKEGRKRLIYRQWSKAKRKDFHNDIIGIIRQSGLQDVGIGIPQSVYDAVMTPERLKKYGKTPDGLCATLALAQAGGFAWDNRAVYKQAPNIIYERGDRLKKCLEWAHAEFCASKVYGDFYQLSILAPAPKSKEFPQLQAADYLAFEVAKRASHYVDPNPPADAILETLADGRKVRKTRHPLLALYAGKKNGVGINIYHAPTAEILEKLLQVIEAEPDEASNEKKRRVRQVRQGNGRVAGRASRRTTARASKGRTRKGKEKEAI